MTFPSLPYVPTIVSTLPTKPDTNSSWYQSLSGAFDSAASAFDKAMKSNAMAWISPGLWSVYNKGPEIYNALKGKTPYDVLDAAVDLFTGDNPSPLPQSPSAPSYSSSPARRATVDYLNAELAKHYGMGKASAYQEALSNTSYQRAVRDMQAAGLNPAVLFGSGRVSGANSSIYASDGSSGSYSRSRGSGRASSDGKLFSSSAYAAIQAIGGLVGIKMTKRPDGFWIGSQTAKGAMALLDDLMK